MIAKTWPGRPHGQASMRLVGPLERVSWPRDRDRCSLVLMVGDYAALASRRNATKIRGPEQPSHTTASPWTMTASNLLSKYPP